MISLLFWCLSAVCNSIMDVCSHHFDKSVFNAKNRYFWETDLSWRNKYISGYPECGRRKVKILKWKFNYPVQLTDSFHLFKSLMIVFICLSIATFNPDWKYDFPVWLKVILTVAVYGLFWNSAFNLFYNKILIKK